MHENLKATFTRAEELLGELGREQQASLGEASVSTRAQQLTHEVLERLASALDRSATAYWSARVAPSISKDHRQKAKIYFPITESQYDFDDILSKWKWKEVRQDHDEIYQYLLSLQPFSAAGNRWLRILKRLVNKGKHVDLVPQKREVEHHFRVSNKQGAAVEYGPGVQFGPGVILAGAHVDPKTQRIVPTAGVTETRKTLVSFKIKDFDMDALGFCQSSIKSTRDIVETIYSRFLIP